MKNLNMYFAFVNMNMWWWGEVMGAGMYPRGLVSSPSEVTVTMFSIFISSGGFGLTAVSGL